MARVFDAAAGQKRPAPSGYGQIHPFRCQKSLPCGRKAALFFLELNEFGPYLKPLSSSYGDPALRKSHAPGS